MIDRYWYYLQFTTIENSNFWYFQFTFQEISFKTNGTDSLPLGKFISSTSDYRYIDDVWNIINSYRTKQFENRSSIFELVILIIAYRFFSPCFNVDNLVIKIEVNVEIESRYIENIGILYSYNLYIYVN